MSEYFDLHAEFSENYDDWDFIARDVLSSVVENKEHPRYKEVVKRLDILEDGKLVDYYEETIYSYTEPIYNFLHPLEFNNFEEDKVLDVVLKTNCTILYSEQKDKSYIALTGCGMNLSQDIALAYLILQKWIPEELIGSVCKQEGLSISKEDFKTLKEAIIEQSQHYSGRFKQIKSGWEKL